MTRMTVKPVREVHHDVVKLPSIPGMEDRAISHVSAAAVWAAGQVRGTLLGHPFSSTSRSDGIRQLLLPAQWPE